MQQNQSKFLLRFRDWVFLNACFKKGCCTFSVTNQANRKCGMAWLAPSRRPLAGEMMVRCHPAGCFFSGGNIELAVLVIPPPSAKNQTHKKKTELEKSVLFDMFFGGKSDVVFT